MDHQYPTVAKIPILDTGKFEQWQFRIQQYLQHEHYALSEVIEFGDSYVVHANTTDTTGGDKSGRTLTLTAEDMQRKKNDDDLNQKFLTSLAPEWLMHTIVWRNRNDLDTMSLDDLYNHLKVYESEVQKKPEQNSQNMAFISSAKHSSRNEDGNTASVPTASVSVTTISQDTACAYIASQSSSFQIKFEDINQIDEDNMEEMDIKWNMALLSMRMGHFARECRAPRSQDRGRRDNIKQGSKAEEQAPKALMAIDGVGWDWSYMENDKEDHALVADEVAPAEFALMANTSAESKVFDNSLCSKDCKKNNDSLNSKIIDLTDKLFDANNFIYHYKLALAQIESRLVEYKEREVKYIEKIRTLEYYNESYKECNDSLKKKLETLQQEKEGVDGKLAGLLTASKDLDNLIKSQRSEKNKEGLGYTVVPPLTAQLYLSPKKDLSWTGLPESANDTVTDYSRPSPTAESISEDDQNRNTFVFETVASPITSKPFIKFVRPKDSQSDSKTDKKETPKKPPVKYAEQYRKPNMKPKARENQRNLNNLKSHQLGPDFVMKKEAYLANDCRKRVKQNFTPRPFAHKPYILSQRPVKTHMNDARPNKTFFNKQAHSYTNRPVYRTSAVRSPSRALWVPIVNRNYSPVNRKFSTGSRNFPTVNRKFLTASRKFPTGSTKSIIADMGLKGKAGSSHNKIDDKGYWDSGKGTIKTGKLEFEYVYFVKDLKYNMFSVSQICDNNNSVLFTDSECIKDATSQEVKKDVSYLRYIALPNWDHDALLEFSSIGHMKTLTVESPIPTISSRVPTAYSTDSQEPSSDARLISKRVANQEETPSLDNILSLTNRFEDILGGTTNSDESNGEEVDISNMETVITTSPTPTLRIHKDHPKSQIIGPVDTPIQTRNKSKEISDALQDPSWVEAMQKELLQFKIQNVWTLVDYPKGVRPIGTKWVLKNKKDERDCHQK
nr:hypothetical protein [Tanacetum cinerariifolium]